MHQQDRGQSVAFNMLSPSRDQQGVLQKMRRFCCGQKLVDHRKENLQNFRVVSADSTGRRTSPMKNPRMFPVPNQRKSPISAQMADKAVEFVKYSANQRKL
jgi:hypothetical protein